MESILKSVMGLGETAAATETTAAAKDATTITEQVIENPDKIGEFFAGLGGAMRTFAWNLFVAIIIWIVGILIIKLICNKILPKALKKSKLSEDVHRFIITTVRVVLYVVIIIIGINALGIHAYSLVAVLGACLVAVGLSLQGSLSNFAGGILLLMFKPFIKGDYISVNNIEGIVLSVSILYTRIRTLDNRIIMLPNGTLSNSNIENHFMNGIRRVDIEFTVPYSEDFDRIKKIMRSAMLTNEFVLKEQDVYTIVLNLNAEGMHIQNRSWCKSTEYWNALFKMGEIIAKALKEYDIPVASSSSVQVKMLDNNYNKMGAKRRVKKSPNGDVSSDESYSSVGSEKSKISDEYGNVNTKNTYEVKDEELELRDKKPEKKAKKKTKKESPDETVENPEKNDDYLNSDSFCSYDYKINVIPPNSKNGGGIRIDPDDKQ